MVHALPLISHFRTNKYGSESDSLKTDGEHKQITQKSVLAGVLTHNGFKMLKP